MKNVFIIFITLLVFMNAHGQNIGVGTTLPAASAQLDITSTTRGFLPPRMTIVQRNAIVKPAAGLIIWCTNCIAPAGELEVYNGYSWTNITGGISPSGTVTICNQVWMDKNLDVATYRNGDPIPKVSDDATWEALTTGAYCYYNNDSATYAIYGKLYNWYAVNDSRGLAPSGWHVPSSTEWTTLESCLGGFTIAGGAMKETGTAHWTSPNTGATNSSGFTALPTGYRVNTGTFGQVGKITYWWTSTLLSPTEVWGRSVFYNDSNLTTTSYIFVGGQSVRCLRN